MIFFFSRNEFNRNTMNITKKVGLEIWSTLQLRKWTKMKFLSKKIGFITLCPHQIDQVLSRSLIVHN